MKLHEYQTKAQLQRYNIPVQYGEIATLPYEARNIVEKLKVKAIIKAQLLTNRRERLLGSRVVNTPQEAEEAAYDILHMEIDSYPITRVLVEPYVRIDEALYIGIGQDRSIGKSVLIVSTEGGIRVEESAFANPETVSRVEIDPLIGLRSYQVLKIASNLNLSRDLYRPLDRIAQGMYQCYVDCDATLLEINPLVVTPDHELLALDAKMIIDDNALFRHPELAALRDMTGETPIIQQARRMGITYIPLKGQIGCIVNGAGLAMATMDVITTYGDHRVRPANFLDIGGGASVEKIIHAFEILQSNSDVRVILMNIFGGMTRGSEVAEGICQVYEKFPPSVPLIVRLHGTDSHLGHQRLIEANLQNVHFANTLTEAALSAIDHASR